MKVVRTRTDDLNRDQQYYIQAHIITTQIVPKNVKNITQELFISQNISLDDMTKKYKGMAEKINQSNNEVSAY